MKKTCLNYLFSAQIEYLSFLRNINVPEHEKKIRSEKHIKEQKKCLSLFNKSLSLNNVNTRLITLEKITPEHIGYYHAYLLNNMLYNNNSYNNKITSLSTFFEWALEKYSVDRKNPFSKVQKRRTFVNKDVIDKKEFESLLNIITPENRSGNTSNGRNVS